MAEKIKIHPITPHLKRIFEASDYLKAGNVLVFPTDTQYAIGCLYTNKKGIDRIREIRHLDNEHLLTLLCDSLSGISKFGQLSDDNFKIIKKLIPGPYTFILPATKDLPKLLVELAVTTFSTKVPITTVGKMAKEINSASKMFQRTANEKRMKIVSDTIVITIAILGTYKSRNFLRILWLTKLTMVIKNKMTTPNLIPKIRNVRVIIVGVYKPKVESPTTCFKNAITVAITGNSKIRIRVLSGMPFSVRKLSV